MAEGRAPVTSTPLEHVDFQPTRAAARGGDDEITNGEILRSNHTGAIDSINSCCDLLQRLTEALETIRGDPERDRRWTGWTAGTTALPGEAGREAQDQLHAKLG